jgi:hypothetical protein
MSTWTISGWPKKPAPDREKSGIRPRASDFNT